MPDIERARSLRQKPTWAEKLVWSWLRDRRFSAYKFRAKAVRDYILQTGKVEAERIFLTENQSGDLKTSGSKVLLQLK